MANISAAEANRFFSRLLRRASAGETITITSRGKPVASLGPVQAEDDARLAERRRRDAALSAIRAANLARPYQKLGKFKRDWAYDE